MRDDHLMEEKIELLLPRRQVALLAAAALVLLGAVFALGVLVGRQLAQTALAAPRPAPEGTLPALDEAAAREPRDDRPARPAIVPAAAPPPEVPVAAADAAGPAEKPAAAPPHPAPAAAQAAADDEPDPLPEDRPASAKGMVVVAAPKTVVVAAPKPPPRSTMPLPPPPKDLGAFTVQLGASQERADAQRLEARARSAGLRPYVVEANLGARGVWYRVRVGAFETREAADGYRKDVERELRLSAVVMAAK